METTKVPPKRQRRRSPELIILEKAYKLLGDKTRWTQHAAARDKTGQPVDAASVAATRWCAIGAVYKAATTTRDPKGFGFAHSGAIHHLQSEIGSIPHTNDGLGYGAVMRGFERAINKLRAKEKT